MNPGIVIKLLRTAEDRTQGQLADELGITRVYLSQIEKGRKKPSLTFLERVADHYRIPLALLVLREGEEKYPVFSELHRILCDLLAARISLGRKEKS